MRILIRTILLVEAVSTTVVNNGKYFYTDNSKQAIYLDKEGNDVDMCITQRSSFGGGFASTFRLIGKMQENGCLSKVKFIQSPDNFHGDMKSEKAICMDEHNLMHFSGVKLDNAADTADMKPHQGDGALPVGVFKGSAPQFGMTLILGEPELSSNQGKIVIEGSNKVKENNEYTVAFDKYNKDQNKFYIKESDKVWKDNKGKLNDVGDLITMEPRSTFQFFGSSILVDIPEGVFKDGKEKWHQGVPSRGLRILLMREDPVEALVKVKSVHKTRRKPSTKKTKRKAMKRAASMVVAAQAPRTKKSKGNH